MGRGAITKGYIKNLQTGTTQKFMFNPNKIKYDRGSKIIALDSPGMNYPILVYGNTEERSLNFSLYLYGDSTESYIRFLEGLLPSTAKNTKGVTHPLALVVIGTKVRKVAVTKVNVEETEWDNYLKCTEASVTLDMVEVNDII